MERWKDPRTPEWQGTVKGKLLTIFDLAAYEQSAIGYPDDPEQPARPARTDNDKPMFAKKKTASRWNWIVKPEQPLGKVAQEKGRTA